jgi:hypothetical protein
MSGGHLPPHHQKSPSPQLFSVMPVTQVTKTLSVLIMLEHYNWLTEVAQATERVNPPCANSVKTH